PTSPFSGGALLGDRVRMHELSGDDGMFIRSMATRGSMGGLAVHTAQACDVLDAAGFGRILIETVGVGQSELEGAQHAAPAAGVGRRGGLRGISGVCVINKAEREGAERAAQALRSALHLRARGEPAGGGSEWNIPVLLTAASIARGIPELVETFEKHLAWLSATGTLEQRRRRRLEQ